VFRRHDLPVATSGEARSGAGAEIRVRVDATPDFKNCYARWSSASFCRRSGTH
jgi:hypothetical protein